MKKLYTTSLFMLVLVVAFYNPLKAQTPVLYGAGTYFGFSSDLGVFGFDPVTHGGSVTKTYSQSSIAPVGALAYDPANGLYYGTGFDVANFQRGGIIYSFNPKTGAGSVVWNFGNGSDGESPFGALAYYPGNGMFYGLTSRGGTSDSGTLILFNPVTNTDNVLWSFKGGSDGSIPRGGLTYCPANGLFYGFTSGGGANSLGTIISFNPVTTETAVVYSFSIAAEGSPEQNDLTYDPDNGLFYATIEGKGNPFTTGVIISFNPATNGEKIVHGFGGFNDGSFPEGSMVYNTSTKLFYGTTLYSGDGGSSGVIFSFDPTVGAKILYKFLPDNISYDGAEPDGTMVYNPNDGLYYGMTINGGKNYDGIIYSINPVTEEYNKVYDFTGNIDVEEGLGSLVYYDLGIINPTITITPTNSETLCAGTDFYFTYTVTDIFRPGNIFNVELSDANGSFANPVIIDTINAMTGGAIDLVIPANTPAGTHYRVRLTATYPAYTSADNGSDITVKPATLVNVNSQDICSGKSATLLATGATGYTWKPSTGLSATTGSTVTASPVATTTYTITGTSSCGTSATTATITVNNCAAENTSFFGMTDGGGTDSLGTIFKFSLANNQETVVYNFKNNGTDGSGPFGSLTYDSQAKLFYGMTFNGGDYGGGTIISFDPVTNSEKVLWSFGNGSDGYLPYGNLVKSGTSNIYYGMTTTGGDYYGGVIFSFDPSTNQENVLWSFGNGNDGQTPYGDLVYYPSNGLYYGMTGFGGTDKYGTIFSFNPVTNSESVVWNFLIRDGINPFGSLFYNTNNGLLLGMNQDGGLSGVGTIFDFNPDGNVLRHLWGFGAANDGEYPVADFTLNPTNGLLYAALQGGGGSAQNGAIITFDPSSNLESPVYSFKGGSTDGSQPQGDLTFNAGNGLLYTMTIASGAYGLGTLVSLNPLTNSDSLLWSFGTGNDGQFPSGKLAIYYGATAKNNSDSIITGPISPSSYCTGASAGVPYAITGTFNAGNVFTAQLSDSSGSFASPVTIGTLTSTAAETINATIPTNTIAGSAYRIRVTGSNPTTTGSDNGSNIIINATPTSTFVADHDTVCTGAIVNFTYIGNASNLATYAWTFTGGTPASAAGRGPQSNQWSKSGTYFVSLKVTENGGCSSTFMDTIVVSAGPLITAKASSPDVCAGNADTLTATGCNTYSWVPATGLNSATGAIVFATPTQSTTYTVTCTSADACEIVTATVAVSVSGIIGPGAVTPTSAIICPNTATSMVLNSSNGNKLQWQISSNNTNWTNIAGATAQGYTTKIGDATSKKYYRCLSANACYTASSNTAVVDISNPVITVTATNVTDNSATLNWSPIGSGNYTVSYTGATSGTKTNATPPFTLTGLASGSYSVTVTQATPVGCPASGTVTVTTLCPTPTGLKVTATTANSISVSWNGAAGNYRVYYSQLSTSSPIIQTKDISVTTATLSSLLAGATYEIYVSSLNCGSTPGQPSAFVMGTTTTSIACAAPVIDSVTVTCSSQIQVWAHGSTSNQYQFYVQRLTPVLQSLNSYSVQGGNFSIVTTTAGQNYLIAAVSVCGGATSQATVWPTAVVVPAACSNVSNLLLSQPTCTGFTAAWNADNCSTNTLNSYQLSMRKQGTIAWNTYTVLPNTTLNVVNWLKPNSTYQCYVKSAYSCNGYSVYGPSSSVQVITTQSTGCRVEAEGEPNNVNKSPAQTVSGNNEMLSLYPNPNAGEFTIDFSRLNSNTEPVRIEVRNLLGQTMLTQITSIADGHLNEFINMPANSTSGIYFVRLIVGDKIFNTEINISR